tara:strand:- start:150 stop:908 length:759 start_codon:yes stop_codon:yes gene_type:complete
MACLALETVVKEPTHVVECSGSNQYAYTLAQSSKTFSKKAWKGDTDEDEKEIEALNATLPENCTKMEIKFTAKFGNKLSEFYLGKDFIVGFEDRMFFPMPDAIFLQRVSPYTKTFDLVCFYGKTNQIFSIVDRNDLDAIRDWYPNKIYSCSADPLPMKFVEEFLKSNQSDDMYEKLFDELFKVEESSCSEYEQSEESEEDYESEDAHESSEEEQEVSEYEKSSDEDDEYEPDMESDNEQEKEEPTKKKRKMF